MAGFPLEGGHEKRAPLSSINVSGSSSSQLNTIRTQTSFVVEVWISEVEVTMEFSVIEFNRHRMMRILIDRPGKSGQI